MTESIKQLMKKELRYQWQPIIPGAVQSFEELPGSYSSSVHMKWRENVCEWMYKVGYNKLRART